MSVVEDTGSRGVTRKVRMKLSPLSVVYRLLLSVIKEQNDA